MLFGLAKWGNCVLSYPAEQKKSPLCRVPADIIGICGKLVPAVGRLMNSSFHTKPLTMYNDYTRNIAISQVEIVN